MANTTGLPVLFSAGNHGARPAASAVGSGGLYACSTHTKVYQSDGVSTWTDWFAATAAATITTKDEGSSLSSTVTTLDFVGAGVVASGSGATTTVTIAGAGGGGSSALAFVYLATVAR